MEVNMVAFPTQKQDKVKGLEMTSQIQSDFFWMLKRGTRI